MASPTRVELVLRALVKNIGFEPISSNDALLMLILGKAHFLPIEEGDIKIQLSTFVVDKYIIQKLSKKLTKKIGPLS